MEKLKEYIKIMQLGEYSTTKTFKDLTTIKIGGNIKLLYYPNTIDNFILFYKYYLENINLPLIVIGNGSNILASSKNFDGIVVCFKKIKFKYFIYKDRIVVSSGVMIMDIINYCKKKNLGGLEKLSYIPATIGGMIKMNAGAYNDVISNYILNFKTINKEGNMKIYDKEKLKFSYRKCHINEDEIILECTLKLTPKNENEINKEIQFIKNNREAKQPINTYNAGSTFKNINNMQIWKFIDEQGLRGFRISDAMVSNKHCNFLINKNACSSDDMIKLINYIKGKIKENYNLNLECEWDLINFWKKLFIF